MRKIALVSIIDDDRAFQLSTRKNIERTNLVTGILQFADGLEAIDYFAAHKNDAERIPDLVFLDLDMPYLDGWQFLEELQAHEFIKEIAIYICTSSYTSADRDRIKAYPVLKGYMVKPITYEEIYAVLNHQLISDC